MNGRGIGNEFKRTQTARQWTGRELLEWCVFVQKIFLHRLLLDRRQHAAEDEHFGNVAVEETLRGRRLRRV